jgi:hypothetical protein
MSSIQYGSSQRYSLPSSVDSVPMAWRSNKDPRPTPSNVSTVVVPSLTGQQTDSGTSIISVPCSTSSGYGSDFYLRVQVAATGTKAADGKWKFKGSVGAASSLINSMSTFVNSTQIDNLQNFDQIADICLAHSTSKSFLENDASVLMGTGVEFAETKDAAGVARNVCIPLLGLLGSQQAIPLFAIQGSLQININWNTVARSIFSAANAWGISGFNVTRCELVYNRAQVEQSFIEQVRSEMMMGQSYVYGFTNYQSSPQVTQPGSGQSFQYGLNMSSLRGIVANQVLNADLSAIKSQGKSVINGLNQFIVLLDGRQVSNVVLDNQAQQFAEMNKVFSKLYDASVSDAATASTYPTDYYAVGQSCLRTTEALSFSGSPCSVLNVNFSVTDADHALCFVFIADKQLLISGDGSVAMAQ